jgi:hypothetical protein
VQAGRGRRDCGERCEDVDDHHWAVKSDDNSSRPGSDPADGRHQYQDSLAPTRSASGAAKGAITADGTMRSSPTSPTAVGPPARYATIPSPTVKAHSAVQAPRKLS